MCIGVVVYVCVCMFTCRHHVHIGFETLYDRLFKCVWNPVGCSISLCSLSIPRFAVSTGQPDTCWNKNTINHGML